MGLLKSKIEEYKITNWLPTTLKEVEQHGWDELDVILFSGDAYVDHPSFGAAVVGRIIEAEGYKIAIVPQPNWRDDLRDFKKLGKARLFFGITSGCMDSMVNHYTAGKRLRSDDAYSPGGKAGFRPDYAAYVYAKILKELYPDVPVVLGGIEASLRRLTHYDYWSDTLKPGILADTNADLLIYGMGEKPLRELLHRLDKNNEVVSDIKDLKQSVCLLDHHPTDEDVMELHSHEKCLNDKRAYAENFKSIEEASNSMSPPKLLQAVGKRYLIVNEPFTSLSTEDHDAVYQLPFTRLPHPKYKKRGEIPAYTMIRHSVNIHRGCFGGCSFCTISMHQGKFIQSRSEKSVLQEVEAISKMEDFKGYISDLGGPSANMYQMKGKNELMCAKCKRSSCIYPDICKNLNTDHQPLIDLYRKAAQVKGVKKVFIGSGIRYDLFPAPLGNAKEDNHGLEYFDELVEHHTSGRLKVAPEHTSDAVLSRMRKPSFRLFDALKKRFEKVNQNAGLKQQLIPYFISSHPGSNVADMAQLASKTKQLGYRLEQVQDFTPTPMTHSTVMYYSGIDPYGMKAVYTARSKEEKLEQRTMFFWYKSDYQVDIKNILQRNGLQKYMNELGIRPERGGSGPKKQERSKKQRRRK